MTKNNDYISLIRQKVNNIYTNLFDERVVLKKEYMDLLGTPKRLYHQWINGDSFSPDDVVCKIESAMLDAVDVKDKYARQKLKLSWGDYKKLCETYFRKMFDNYICLDSYEDKRKIMVSNGCWSEDNFCVSYFCKGLDGYFRNYEKEASGLYVRGSKNKNYKIKRCVNCGRLIKNTGNKKMYCDECRKIKDKERYLRYNKKRTTNRKPQ
jgi:hypothetical protein